jgi:hypothetical protein
MVLFGLMLRNLPKRELTPRGVISFAEKIIQGLFDFLDRVDFSLSETCAKRVDRNVYVNYFVGFFKETSGDGRRAPLPFGISVMFVSTNISFSD